MPLPCVVSDLKFAANFEPITESLANPLRETEEL